MQNPKYAAFNHHAGFEKRVRHEGHAPDTPTCACLPRRTVSETRDVSYRVTCRLFDLTALLVVARALCDTLLGERLVRGLSVVQSKPAFSQTNSSHVLGPGASLVECARKPTNSLGARYRAGFHSLSVPETSWSLGCLHRISHEHSSNAS